jgi:ATP-dependent Clp protease ATP-binding subunit ClpX
MNKNQKCDICGSLETEQNTVVDGGKFNICRSCAETALYLMHIKDSETPIDFFIDNEKTEVSFKTPKEYKSILDDYVIGQHSAKKVLAVAIYNHLLRIKNPELKIDKSNVMFIGPTGSGKTFLAETIAKHLDIPLAIVNTTSLTAAGYIGEDVSSVIERLWKNAGEDVQKAQKGIIFLDEIDKNRTSGGGTNNKDVSGKAVQQELLKILEGDIVKIYPEGSAKNRKSGSAIEINTKDILFISAGAFVGLKDKPGVQVTALGNVQKAKDISNIKMQELLDEYGIIPEFYGRFPNIVELEELNIKSMENIMTQPKDNIIEQYKNLFSLSGIQIEFTKRFIDEVAKEALEVKTGARGLRTIMEDKLNDIMFNISEYTNKNILIDFKYNNIKIIEECEDLLTA